MPRRQYFQNDSKKLTPDGIESVLHAFKGDDGSNPNAGVIADSAGNLYGTTIGGGKYGNGTTITAGSFVGTGSGPFYFVGKVHGVEFD
jgi:hypothetical protein